MNYTINDLRQEIFGKVYEVYEIFQNFFGEGFTDLQGVPDDNLIVDVIYSCTDIAEVEPTSIELSEEDFAAIKSRFNNNKSVIMVWWPTVTVTNENDRSVQIQDLYAKIEVTLDGRIPYEYRGFKLNRTTFPEIQFNSGYLHSHIPHFQGVPVFAAPCLGTGPINNTIMDLKNTYEEALWMLFCQELSLYVTVESLAGGPYFRMETIGSASLMYNYSGYDSSIEHLDQLSSYYRSDPARRTKALEILNKFTIYYLEHGHLCFNYKNGSFESGMPYYDFIIDISNSFIDWLNMVYSDKTKYTLQEAKDAIARFYERNILVETLISNGKFYKTGEMPHRDLSRYEGQEMFIFKGEMKHLHIIQEENAEMTVSTILSHTIAMYILNSVLRIINYRYKNEHNRKQISSSSSEGDSSAISQGVIYL